MTGYKRIFIDTAPYIYYLERNPNYYDVMKEFFNMAYDNYCEFITSAVTVEEYSIIPYREKKEGQLLKFQKFIADTETKIVDINAEIADKAAKIRAEYVHFKAMDALQLAAAVIWKGDMFLTNDKQLKQFEEIAFKSISCPINLNHY